MPTRHRAVAAEPRPPMGSRRGGGATPRSPIGRASMACPSRPDMRLRSHPLSWYKAIHFDTVPGFLAPGSVRRYRCPPTQGGPAMRALILIAALATIASCSQTVSRRKQTSRADDCRRVAGPPQTCVSTSVRREPALDRSADGGLRLWTDDLGSTICRPCPALSQHNTIIVDARPDQYCRGDRIRGLEPGAIIPGPIVQPWRLGSLSAGPRRPFQAPPFGQKAMAVNG